VEVVDAVLAVEAVVLPVDDVVAELVLVAVVLEVLTVLAVVDELVEVVVVVKPTSAGMRGSHPPVPIL